MGNVPKLRFAEFNTKWDKKNLEKYGELVRGLTYSPDDIREEGLLVLRSSNIKNNEFTLNIDNVYVDMQIKEEYLTQKNDILICVRNGSKRLIGKSTIINNSLEYATHGAFMSVFRGKYNKFIYHWMQTPLYYKQVHKNLGATINSINGSDLKKFKTYFPQKQEQEKIASFLSYVDKKLEKLEKKIALQEKYKKAMMQKLFSQEIRFKTDDGSDFPDWKEKKFKDFVLDYRLGGNYANSEEETRYPLIKMGNISRGKINLKKIEFIKECEEISNIDIIKYGDIFFNTRNTLDLVGKVAIWRNELPLAYYNSNLMWMKFENNFFMNYRLNSYQGLKVLRRIATGTTSVAAIYTKDLLKIKLEIPSLKEQQKIANFLSSLDKKIEATKKQKQKANEFKKGLLQQMFV